jgi:hypothetical protein
MMESAQDAVTPEARTLQSGHVSHHKSPRRKRLAAKVMLILAFIIFSLAVCDFAHNAFVISKLFYRIN